MTSFCTTRPTVARNCPRSFHNQQRHYLLTPRAVREQQKWLKAMIALERRTERRQHRQCLFQRTRISCFTATLHDKEQHKAVATFVAFFQRTKIMIRWDYAGGVGVSLIVTASLHDCTPDLAVYMMLHYPL